jgi:hypothetical protein
MRQGSQIVSQPWWRPPAIRTSMSRRRLALLCAVNGLFLALLGQAPVQAQQSTEALAAAAQNPVAAMSSLPFQNNSYFGAGPNHDQSANVLSIQPVLPFTVGDWNIISRTIAPLISLPSITAGLEDITTAAPSSSDPFGLGDINQTFYFSPAAPSAFIWGLGPSFNFPTATNRNLGSGKFSIGPGAVGLVMPKPWVVGLLARQLFSVAGSPGRADVNQTLLQPLVNYNMADGWYLVSSPIITTNWNANSSDRWNVPLGGGIGKIFRVGGKPLNASFQAFDYVVHPTAGPRWTVRFQLQFLFPR